MRYRVKDRMSVTLEDGRIMGPGTILNDPSDFELSANRECLEFLPADPELYIVRDKPKRRRSSKEKPENEESS